MSSRAGSDVVQCLIQKTRSRTRRRLSRRTSRICRPRPPIHNSVDTTQAGTYEVTYKVTDSQGASSTKTITVTVKEKENTQGSTDNDTNKGNTDKTASSGDKQSSVETGDSTNLVIWTALMMISVLGAVLSKLFRRRIQR